MKLRKLVLTDEQAAGLVQFQTTVEKAQAELNHAQHGLSQYAQAIIDGYGLSGRYMLQHVTDEKPRRLVVARIKELEKKPPVNKDR